MSSQNNTDNYKLTITDRKIIKMLLEPKNYTDQEIADKLGIQRETVNKHKNNPKVQEEVERLQRTALDDFLDVQKEAVKVGAELLKSDSEYIKLSAAKMFLSNIQAKKLDLGGIQLVYMDSDDEKL